MTPKQKRLAEGKEKPKDPEDKKIDEKHIPTNT